MRKPKYKDLKFKSREEFNKWLKETAKYKICFEDDGQDFLIWYLDKYGEVLHSDLQAFVWNGKFVDINKTKEGHLLKFTNGDTLKHKVKKIEELK